VPDESLIVRGVEVEDDMATPRAETRPARAAREAGATAAATAWRLASITARGLSVWMSEESQFREKGTFFQLFFCFLATSLPHW